MRASELVCEDHQPVTAALQRLDDGACFRRGLALLLAALTTAFMLG